MKKINLFCLTFAGGNKYSYRLFYEKAPSFLNIVTLEYPGRGSKLSEPLISDIHILVDNLYKQIKEKIDAGRYAIYGHSMGGLISYLLTHKIQSNYHTLPEHLFITGTSGPSAISRSEKKRHLLEEEDFVNEIRSLGGMPEEILNNKDLLQYLGPILRNDFKVSETYIYENCNPLNIHLTVITGLNEDLKEEEILSWQDESTFKIDFKKLPGGHFFILHETNKVLEIISEKLEHQLTSLTHG